MNTLANDLYSVKTAIADLKEKCGVLAIRKRTLEIELTTLNNRIRGTKYRLPKVEYENVVRRQKKIKEQFLEIEKEREPLNQELKRWYAMEDELRVKANIGLTVDGIRQDTVVMESPIKNKIIQLRNTHLQFAEDNTRISSMRLMAAQFANELTEILKDA